MLDLYWSAKCISEALGVAKTIRNALDGGGAKKHYAEIIAFVSLVDSIFTCLLKHIENGPDSSCRDAAVRYLKLIENSREQLEADYLEKSEKMQRPNSKRSSVGHAPRKIQRVLGDIGQAVKKAKTEILELLRMIDFVLTWEIMKLIYEHNQKCRQKIVNDLQLAVALNSLDNNSRTPDEHGLDHGTPQKTQWGFVKTKLQNKNSRIQIVQTSLEEFFNCVYALQVSEDPQPPGKSFPKPASKWGSVRSSLVAATSAFGHSANQKEPHPSTSKESSAHEPKKSEPEVQEPDQVNKVKGIRKDGSYGSIPSQPGHSWTCPERGATNANCNQGTKVFAPVRNLSPFKDLQCLASPGSPAPGSWTCEICGASNSSLTPGFCAICGCKR